MNAILKKDIEKFVKTFKLADSLSNTSFLITGGTGLIGSILIHSLIALNKNIKILAPVRNMQKALSMFSKYELQYIRFIECDLLSYNYNHIDLVDYIVHCAGPTASKYFVSCPVETFNSIIISTQQILKYAKLHPIKGFVYLSSLEIYGTISDDVKYISEDYQGYLDPMSIRSCYPIAKRATENICASYADEYHVPIKIARLTQTTGAGVSDNDDRVIVQFSRLASQNKDIILYSLGNAARPYCYTMDCVSAILYILLKGNVGEAYNIANQESYISAKNLAYFIRDNFAPQINIRTEIDDNKGYAPETKIKLSTNKLYQLGWRPKYSLYDIIDNVIASFNCN